MLDTSIQWADSTLNLQAGCTGCELWNPAAGIRRCYAGQLTNRFGGNKGWPERFELPTIFPERIKYVGKWSDLTGKNRPNKPWLDGLPRTIFLNDMGDSFSEGMTIDWMTPFIEELAASPHIIIILTKRPQRMAAFFNDIGVPKNFWLCTSVTNKASLSRIPHLLTIKNAPVLGLSVEPLWEDLAADMMKIPGIERLSWIKVGGESGAGAKQCDLQWLRNILKAFHDMNHDCSVFMKQTGTRAYENGNRLKLADFEGGDWNEWPQDLKVREMPWDAIAAA